MAEPTLKRIKVSAEDDQSDQQYFDSYAHLQCHKTMLFDAERSNAYRRAILRSYQGFYKKSVLDVGCGTAILSVFSAQAGAAKVYAVEASEIIRVAEQVVKGNFLSRAIELINQPMEQCLLPSKVDVIVSEWMGYTLMTEWMIFSVLKARDKWLKPGGLLFPCKATVYIVAMSEPIDDCWEDQSSEYKVDLSCCAQLESSERIGKMFVQEVIGADLISRPHPVFTVDLNSVAIDQLVSGCRGRFELRSFGKCKLTGFCLYFDVKFPNGDQLTTSPDAEVTHWVQTVLTVEPFEVAQDDKITGELQFHQNPINNRLLTVSLLVDNHKEFTYDSYTE